MTIPYSKQQPAPINQLSNVNVSESLADGEVLKYNATTKEWENKEDKGGATAIVATENLITPDLGAGASLTSGATQNILLGKNTGQNLTTGDNNVAIGFDAFKNGNGNNEKQNVFVGNYSGEFALGQFNVMIGYEAGKGTGNYSTTRATIVGERASKNSVPERLTSIGYATGFNNAGFCSTYLGNAAGLDGGGYANTIVISAEAGGLNPTSANSCFIKPIRNATGVSNALFYDATSGEITYDSAGGGGGTEIVETDNLITPDLNAGASLTSGAISNILLGKNTGQSLTTGDANVAIGFNIFKNRNTNAGVYIGRETAENGGNDDAIAIGNQTAKDNTGREHIAIGKFAGRYTGGDNALYNIAIGTQALESGRAGIISGGGSIAFGFESARGSNNNNDRCGDNIISIGTFAHTNCRPEISKSIFIGDSAGFNTQSGSSGSVNIFIGTGAGFNLTSASNTTVNNATVVGGRACFNGVNQNTSSGGLFLGYGAGRNVAYGNQIVLNGSGADFDPNSNEGLFVKPIRAVAHNIGGGLTYYDTTSGELTVSNTDITKAHANYTVSPTDFTGFTPQVFTNTDFNTNSFYNTGTGRFTAPNNGLYTFQLHYQLSTNDEAIFNWRVNTSVKQTDEVYNAHGGSSFRTFQSTFTTILATNEFVELELASTTGTVRFETSKYNGVRAYYVGK